MSGVEPAVVNRPHYGDVAVCQIIKQYPVVQEITVHVVDVYDVGADDFYLSDELQRSVVGRQSVAVEEACGYAMPCHAPPVAHRKEMRFAGLDAIASVAVGDMAIPTVGSGQFAYLLHDAPRGGVYPQHGIYLEKFLHLSVSELKRSTHFFMTRSSE